MFLAFWHLRIAKVKREDSQLLHAKAQRGGGKNSRKAAHFAVKMTDLAKRIRSTLMYCIKILVYT